MSRYVQHKHGLYIGSDNIFTVIDDFAEAPLERFRDGYRALVGVHGYTYDTIHTGNVGIQTPVEQLLYRSWTEETGETFGRSDIPMTKRYIGLSNRGRQILERVIGPQVETWDTYTKVEQRRCSIFFRRRKDALTFVRHLSDTIKGIRYSDF